MVGWGGNTNGDFQGLQLKEDVCARDFKFLDWSIISVYVVVKAMFGMVEIKRQACRRRSKW